MRTSEKTPSRNSLKDRQRSSRSLACGLVKTTKWDFLRRLCAHSLEPKLGVIPNFQTVSFQAVG
jgi:hypothetical protein